MPEPTPQEIDERLMNAIGFTGEEREANRKGSLSQRQIEHVQRRVDEKLKGYKPRRFRLGRVAAGSLIVAVVIAVPVILTTYLQDWVVGEMKYVLHQSATAPQIGPQQASDVAWLFGAIVVIAVSIPVSIIWSGQYWHNQWVRLQADLQRGKVRIKTLKGRVTVYPPKEPEETPELRAVNKFLPGMVQPDKSMPKYAFSIRNRAHMVDFDPVQAFVQGHKYRIYYLGNQYTPMVLSAEEIR